MDYYSNDIYKNKYGFNNIDDDYYYPSKSERTKGVIGLKNINNYLCFMNSSLQCLSHIKPLFDKFFEIKQLKSLGLSFFELLVKMYDDSEDKYFIPKNILNQISSYYKEYLDIKQQGANEFISRFLTTINDEIKSPIHPIKIFEIPQEPLKEKFLKKYEFYKKNRSFITDLFYGNVVYLTKCPNCNNIINAIFSIFNILELSIYPLRDKGKISLEQLIESYSSEQFIDYNTFCIQCKNQVRPIAKTDIVHSSDILIIYINKVINNKLWNININFPYDLYITNYSSSDKFKKKICYNLIGFIEHFGTESFGHYIAKCKNFVDGKWYKFDDLSVEKINIPEKYDKTSDSDSVIILFYQKSNI